MSLDGSAGSGLFRSHTGKVTSAVDPVWDVLAKLFKELSPEIRLDSIGAFPPRSVHILTRHSEDFTEQRLTRLQNWDRPLHPLHPLSGCCRICFFLEQRTVLKDSERLPIIPWVRTLLNCKTHTTHTLNYIDIHGVQGQVRTALGFETGVAAQCLVC